MQTKELRVQATNGLPVVGILIICGLVLGYWIYHALSHTQILQGVFAVVLAGFWIATWIGLLPYSRTSRSVVREIQGHQSEAVAVVIRSHQDEGLPGPNINGTPIKVKRARQLIEIGPSWCGTWKARAVLMSSIQP